MNQDIITTYRLSKSYELSKGIFSKRSFIQAVNDVSIRIRKGEICGVVGESGCGKSTLGRLLLRLEEPTSGKVFFNGEDISTFSNTSLRAFRRKTQIIFQDPYASLNPRQPVGNAIEEGLLIHNIGTPVERKELVDEISEIVGLSKEQLQLYPHELSGGQRQRVCIARALILRPEFVVCDEPLSALDVSIQAQIINLLLDLQERYQLTYLFISHDLSIVRHLADRIMVMYLGYVVEEAPKEELFSNPLHPYTQVLLSSIPVHHPSLRKGVKFVSKELLRHGEIEPSRGCVFEPRCPIKQQRCKKDIPEPREVFPYHYVRCIAI
ncbi:MAG: ATP-binding cassette domain-containing protein [Syntrophobacterales bacterium]|nr:ATP-binding cassette domain-containing protein [Syntrophobacterales bacterium]